MNWVFKTGDHFKLDSTTNKVVVSLVQKANFRGKVGDDVLVLEKRKSDWEFIAHYRILEIAPPNETQSEKKEFVITLELVKQFEGDKLLDDYIYSIRRVTNYATPIRHFNRKYSRLKDAEYEAIVEDNIYEKRTIVGTVLNAMHRDHQEAFILYVAEESPEQLTGKVDIDKVLELLLDYLNYSVIKPAQYLRESANILRSILNDNEYAEIGFGSGTELIKKTDTKMIAPQVVLIEEYLNQLPFNENQKLGSQIRDVKDNPKFKRLFKNTPLPITLN